MFCRSSKLTLWLPNPTIWLPNFGMPKKKLGPKRTKGHVFSRFAKNYEKMFVKLKLSLFKYPRKKKQFF